MNNQKRGRPRVLKTDRQRRKVLAALARGIPFEHAGGAVGVTPKTVRNEMGRDPVFSDQVAAAIERGNFRLVSFLERSALKDPKIALAIAKAKLPAYQQQKNVMVQGHVEHTHTELPIEARRDRLLEIMDVLRERGGIGGDSAALNGNGKHNGNGSHKETA